MYYGKRGGSMFLISGLKLTLRPLLKMKATKPLIKVRTHKRTCCRNMMRGFVAGAVFLVRHPRFYVKVSCYLFA